MYYLYCMQLSKFERMVRFVFVPIRVRASFAVLMAHRPCILIVSDEAESSTFCQSSPWVARSYMNFFPFLIKKIFFASFRWMALSGFGVAAALPLRAFACLKVRWGRCIAGCPFLTPWPLFALPSAPFLQACHQRSFRLCYTS